MPEIAEVETVRRRTEQYLKGLKITGVEAETQDRFLFQNAELNDVKKALLGAQLTGTGRRGKYFWFTLDRKIFPIFHLGMSGNIALLGAPLYQQDQEVTSTHFGGLRLWSGKKHQADETFQFVRLKLIFGERAHWMFLDPRRFGRIFLSNDPMNHPRIKKLGLDPLVDTFSSQDLIKLFWRKKGSIKGVLLDQTVIAGIGNWLADEILYQSKIDPSRLMLHLSKQDISVIHRKMLSVIHLAVKVSADYEKFPKSWLFPHRWGKKKNARDFKNRLLSFKTVAGRTTAWVPEIQDS